jgi:hypothetical protein
MINTLGVRNPLLLIMSLLPLTSNQDRSEKRASSAAPIATLSSERAQSAYDFVNSIGANIFI